MLIGGANSLSLGLGIEGNLSLDTSSGYKATPTPSSVQNTTSPDDAASYSSSASEQDSSSESEMYRTMRVLQTQLKMVEDLQESEKKNFLERMDKGLSQLVDRIDEGLKLFQKPFELSSLQKLKLEEIRDTFQSKVENLKNGLENPEDLSLGEFESSLKSAYSEFEDSLGLFFKSEKTNNDGPTQFYAGQASGPSSALEESTMTMFDSLFEVGLDKAVNAFTKAERLLNSEKHEDDAQGLETLISHYQRMASVSDSQDTGTGNSLAALA